MISPYLQIRHDVYKVLKDWPQCSKNLISGPCDSADSNGTTTVSSAPGETVSESSDTSSTPATEVGSSNEPQDPSACAATSSETKDESATQVLPSADASSDQDPATSSKCESGQDDSMEVDAECTSSETQIHISSS